MAFLIRIEQWTENLEEATVGVWLKAEGDPVEAGESVVEIITDKVTFEWEAEQAGVLRRIAATENSVIPVGYCIGVIAAADEPLPDVDAMNAALQEQERPEWAPAERPRGGARPLGKIKRVRAVPAARRIAREAEIDLADVAQALNEDRRITVADVEEFIRDRGRG
ncbi:MAG: E3 binding domain-containing protein [Armatimonadota bacterium]